MPVYSLNSGSGITNGNQMNPIAKFLVITGIILIAAGLVWQLGGKHLPLGRLPGDLMIERGNFKLYFPLATSIVLSIVLTLLFRIFSGGK